MGYVEFGPNYLDKVACPWSRHEFHYIFFQKLVLIGRTFSKGHSWEKPPVMVQREVE